MTSGRKKTILHFIDSGGVYGAENVILNLSHEMQAAGVYEPIVGCIVPDSSQRNDLFEAAQTRGLRAEKIIIRNGALGWDLPRAARKLSELGVDLIHSHGYKPSVFGHLMKAVSGIPVMATCHLWFKGENRPAKMRFMIWLELLFYRRFSAVVGVSEAIGQVLLQAGVKPEAIRIVQNGVPVPSGGPDPAIRRRLRQELGLAEDDFVVINTGRLTRQKSQRTLVEAAALMCKEEEGVRFLIVGEGDLHEALKRDIDHRNLADMVSLLGFRSDIPDLLTAADIFALPSLDEGMPMSLIEATAAGLPIVSTAVGDIPKLIVDGKSGRLVPLEDAPALAAAIRDLRHNPDRALALSHSALDIMQREYSAAAMYRQYAEVYAGLI